MKVTSSIIFGAALRFSGYLRKKRPTLTSIAEEFLLRAELFGSDQMKQHGKILVNTHELSHKRLPDQLLSRLADNALHSPGLGRVQTALPLSGDGLSYLGSANVRQQWRHTRQRGWQSATGSYHPSF